MPQSLGANECDHARISDSFLGIFVFRGFIDNGPCPPCACLMFCGETLLMDISCIEFHEDLLCWTQLKIPLKNESQQLLQIKANLKSEPQNPPNFPFLPKRKKTPKLRRKKRPRFVSFSVAAGGFPPATGALRERVRSGRC